MMPLSINFIKRRALQREKKKSPTISCSFQLQQIARKWGKSGWRCAWFQLVGSGELRRCLSSSGMLLGGLIQTTNTAAGLMLLEMQIQFGKPNSQLRSIPPNRNSKIWHFRWKFTVGSPFSLEKGSRGLQLLCWKSFWINMSRILRFPSQLKKWGAFNCGEGILINLKDLLMFPSEYQKRGKNPVLIQVWNECPDYLL